MIMINIDIGVIVFIVRCEILGFMEEELLWNNSTRGCFYESRTKGKRSKMIRYHISLKNKLYYLEIGSFPIPLSAP